MVKQQRIDEIRVRTLAGESAGAIAVRLGISSRTVTRHRSRLGIARTAPPRLTQEQENLMQALVDDGCSVREIARTIGCSDTAVSRRHPDAAWTRTQVSDYATVCRAMRRGGKAAA